MMMMMLLRLSLSSRRGASGRLQPQRRPARPLRTERGGIAQGVVAPGAELARVRGLAERRRLGVLVIVVVSFRRVVLSILLLMLLRLRRHLLALLDVLLVLLHDRLQVLHRAVLSAAPNRRRDARAPEALQIAQAPVGRAHGRPTMGKTIRVRMLLRLRRRICSEEGDGGEGRRPCDDAGLTESRMSSLDLRTDA